MLRLTIRKKDGEFCVRVTAYCAVTGRTKLHQEYFTPDRDDANGTADAIVAENRALGFEIIDRR